VAKPRKARVKVVWKRGAFREIRTLPEVMDALGGTAAEWATKAGAGYAATGARVTGGRGRGRATVYTATTDAMRREARDHNLLRVLGGAGGLVQYTSRAGKTSWITRAQYDNYTRRRG